MQKKRSGKQKKSANTALESIIRYANHCKHRDGFRVWVDREGMHKHCELCGKVIVERICSKLLT